MQFGRIDGNAYTLDFQYPFSALQAFAVALANVTQRLKWILLGTFHISYIHQTCSIQYNVENEWMIQVRMFNLLFPFDSLVVECKEYCIIISQIN